MSTFVLVPGAGGDSYYWHLVVPVLEAHGHEVIDECLQIHGGAGYMKEYGIERAWRDMRLNRIGAGTDEVMLDVIGRSYGL